MKEHSPLDHAEIGRLAAQEGLPWKIIGLDHCQSTNEEAITLIKNDPELLDSGLVLFSEWQGSGRGRRGSRWISPRSRDLLVSIAMHPPVSPDRWTRLTHAAALALCHTLRPEYPVTVKWPNDIYLSKAKVAGILVESITPSVSTDCGIAVIGIGLNVNSMPEDYPENLDAPATSLRMHAGEHPSRLQREPIAASLLYALHRAVLRSREDFPAILEELKPFSNLLGQRVTLTLPGGSTQSGLVKDFGPEGELLLQTDDATQEAPLLSIASADHVRRD
ncbi:MAG: biotin--[acetyl-CoA-carboxylase] ligase [Verrucomicrobiota bacterium]|nr:biotin--[acetyl-CoA-carboxylase] ligase [Verrucomicrobiota bacterium]